MIHPFSLNGRAAHTKMEHRKIQEERGREPEEESSEEHFLKDLYIFMKKRDTPIERIPHLGFKQIDLFVMFKTVKELGGYHQVTAQQLWKQVYNTLGGNPRSTSAATCTRRHYEKLLLPYECHLKGVLMSVLPQHQPKHFGFPPPYGKEVDDGQRAAKRKLLSVALHQNPHGLQSDLPHPSVFAPLLHHPHYYHPGHAMLPPYMPTHLLMPSTAASAAQRRFSFHPPRPGPSPPERSQQPLEQLRYLAEQYKSSSGLSGPLDLSVKGPGPRGAGGPPASSFAPPPSSAGPKFLNTPSPLYAARGVQEVPGDERADEEDEEEARSGADPGGRSPSSSPGRSSDEGAAAATRKRSSPAADYKSWQAEEREGSPEAWGSEPEPEPEPGQTRRGPPPNSKMEIQIPISVFASWMRLYGATKQQLPAPVQIGGGPDKEPRPANLTFHINPQHRDRGAAAAAAEDLRLRRRGAPSPSPSANHPELHFAGARSAGRDVYPFDRQDISKSCSSKAPRSWEGRDGEGQTTPPPRASLARARSEGEEGGREEGGRGSGTPPSAMLMMNSGSASLLQLTTEEVMKLKRIISSSS